MRSELISTRVMRSGPVAQGTLFIAASAFFATVFWRHIALSSTDHGPHIRYAKEIGTLSDITWPHFLYQLLLKAVAPLTGYERGALLILGLCYGLLAVVIMREMARAAPTLGPQRTATLTGLLLVASHIYLPSVLVPNIYYYYLAPIAWHNPTQHLNKLFAILIYFLFVRLFTEPAATRRRVELACLIVLCILSALAKPSFLIAFLPLSAALVSWRLLTGSAPRSWLRDYVLYLALPVVGVLTIQYLAFYEYSGQQRVMLAPFAVFADPAKFILRLPFNFLFPIVVTMLAWPVVSRSTRYKLAWGFVGISIACSVLFVEAGPKLRSGNFLWTGQTGVFLIYVESLLLVITNRAELAGRRLALIWTAFGLHVLCGIGYVAAAMLYSDARWR